MPIIEYKKTTKAIKSARYGEVWNASDWTNYETDNEGYAVVWVSDTEKTTHGKYLIIAENGTGSFGDTTSMSISVSVSANSNGEYPLVSDNSAYIDFTSVPEGTTVSVDNIVAGTMDSSGIFRLTVQHAGYYGVLFELTAYETTYFEVNASDNI